MVETHRLSANMHLEACCCLLKEDSACHRDPQRPVALRQVLQGMRCSRYFGGPRHMPRPHRRFQRLPGDGRGVCPPVLRCWETWCQAVPMLGSITHLQPSMGVPTLPWSSQPHRCCRPTGGPRMSLLILAPPAPFVP